MNTPAALLRNTPRCAVPILPQVIPRPRLNQELERNAQKRITLVLGQAAQGKSSLVAAYLKAFVTPTAWLHLSFEEKDATNFFYLLIAALQHSQSSPDFNNLLNTHLLTLGPRQDTLRFREAINSVWMHLTRPMHIVFDGLELLPDHASCWPLIKTILAEAPTDVRFFLISRVTPPLEIQRMKVRQEAYVLGNETLAFTADEIAAFFKDIHNLVLDPNHLERIHRVTDGWVGGLVLLAESLHRLSSSAMDRFLNTIGPERFAGDALTFFSEEILASQPPDLQQFLIKSSLFETIDPDFLSQLLDRGRVENFLAELTRRNVFIHSVYDPGRGAMFRYNQLFKDFLRSQFTKQLGREERRSYLKQVITLCCQRGDWEQAVSFAIEARDFAQAAIGIRKLGLDMAIRGRLADLAAWIQALPGEMIRQDPWLLFWLTFTRRISGGNRNLNDFQDAYRGFQSRDDMRGQLLALACLIETSIFLGRPPTRIKSLIEEGEAILEQNRSTPFYAYAKTVLWLQIGFGLIFGAVDLVKGISACQNAYLLARRIANQGLQVNAAVVSAMGHLLSGEFILADQSLRKVRQLGGSRIYPEYRTLRNLVNIELALHRGHLPLAQDLLAEVQEDIEAYGFLFLYPMAIDLSGFLAVYQQRFNDARHMAKHLTDVAVLADNPYYQGLAFRLEALALYHEGEFAKALTRIDRAVETLTRTGHTHIHLFRCQALAAIIRFHCNLTAKAQQTLEQALASFRRAGSHLSIAEAHLALGLMSHAAAKRKEAIAHIRRGMDIAVKRDYRHFILLCPNDILRICLLAVELQIVDSDRFVIPLLTEKFAAGDPDRLQELISQHLHAHPQEGMRLKTALYRSSLPRLEIRTLGEFGIWREGTRPLRAKWEGKKPRLLLKAIIARGGRDIHRDQLIEDLWPESLPEAASRNFKVNLHRLRKTLEPSLEPGLASAYIHLKSNRVSLDPELCRVDIDLFEQYCLRIKQLSAKHESEQLLNWARQATALYGGDFLVEEPYAPWVITKREQLREDYLMALFRLIAIYRTQRQWDMAVECCKSALRADPLLELAHRRLMHLYVDQGLNASAIRVYEEFKTTLALEVGATPDPQTTALYHRIRKTI